MDVFRLRDMILQDYSSYVQSFIKIKDSSIRFHHAAERRALQDFIQAHPSIPANPLIAEPLFLAKYIEKAGSGIQDMIALCEQAGLPAPQFRLEAGCFIICIQRHAVTTSRGAEQVEAHDEAQDKAHDEAHEPMLDIERSLLEACLAGPKKSSELLRILGYRTRSGNFKRALSRLLSSGYLEMTLPEVPRSKRQQYRLTDKGHRILEQLKADK